jgi:acyl-CoA reductase-like NAD-dependent aldehyde dehydrogenase
MKKGTFELGGNDAFIVLSDANIDQAVEAAYKSRMLCNG